MYLITTEGTCPCFSQHKSNMWTVELAQPLASISNQFYVAELPREAASRRYTSRTPHQCLLSLTSIKARSFADSTMLPTHSFASSNLNEHCKHLISSSRLPRHLCS